MIGLLPIPAVIRWVAGCYAALVVIVLAALRIAGHAPDLQTSLKLALAGAAALQFGLLFIISFGWRWLWRKVPLLAKLLFPDLNGRWEMTIHWQRDGHGGERDAVAIVRQDLLRMSIEVVAKDSDSQTLSVQPKLDPESRAPLLHYLYRVTPHSMEPNPPSPYDGAAILRVDSDQSMHGNYWTSSRSVGHFVLRRAL